MSLLRDHHENSNKHIAMETALIPLLAVMVGLQQTLMGTRLDIAVPGARSKITTQKTAPDVDPEPVSTVNPHCIWHGTVHG